MNAIGVHPQGERLVPTYRGGLNAGARSRIAFTRAPVLVYTEFMLSFLETMADKISYFFDTEPASTKPLNITENPAFKAAMDYLEKGGALFYSADLDKWIPFDL